uniref:Uncharacterized protein n=1 Tax=Solanum tuberosum TaxID=4113 RepID=M0ZIE6_SOLTU
MGFVYWLLIGNDSSEMEMRRREDCGQTLWWLRSLNSGGDYCLVAERGSVFC